MTGSETLPIWDLSSLYSSPRDPRREEDKTKLQEMARRFEEKYRTRVGQLAPEELLQAFQEEGEMYEISARLNLHAFLSFAEDTQSAENQAMVSEVEELGAAIFARLVFFFLELGKADASAWFENEALEPYHYYITRARKRARYHLSEELESYSIEKNLTGKNGFVTLFDEFMGQFTFEDQDAEGRPLRYTQETALSVLHHPNREYRTRIFRRFLEEVGGQRVVLGNIYNNLILDHAMDVKRRGYEGVMEPRNLSNQVSSGVVNTMLDTVEEGYPLAQRYFRIKAKVLGLDDFTNADIYAPLLEDDRKISFAKAEELVREAYGNFDEALLPLVEDFFKEKRVHARLSESKRSGAFCYGASPELDAFVLLNYTSDVRSVQTLAHELGHGIHHQLSMRQNYTSFDTPLTTAETASVFGEILLNRLLLEKSETPREKLAVLASQMEGIIATVFRQTVLTRFEQAAHEARSRGRVSAGEFCDIWWRENGKLYGDAVSMVDTYRWGWAYIPHFIHTPFYCYAYSFGQLLVLALYNRYREAGDSFRQGYRELLSLGGSDSPSSLVKRTVGLDLEDPQFWSGALRLLEETMREIETLAEQVAAGA